MPDETTTKGDTRQAAPAWAPCAEGRRPVAIDTVTTNGWERKTCLVLALNLCRPQADPAPLAEARLKAQLDKLTSITGEGDDPRARRRMLADPARRQAAEQAEAQAASAIAYLIQQNEDLLDVIADALAAAGHLRRASGQWVAGVAEAEAPEVTRAGAMSSRGTGPSVGVIAGCGKPAPEPLSSISGGDLAELMRKAGGG